jgi:hypothetical protein
MEPGDFVETTQENQVHIVGGFDWTVTANEDVHIISQVSDRENNVTKNLHTYKPSGASEFITSEDFSGAEAIYTSGNSVFIIGLTSSKRVFVEKAEGGTNNFTRVYEATSGKTFDHGVVYINDGKVYYYLMENKTGSAQPLYLQIINLDIADVDPMAPDNFTIESKGETCTGKANGYLKISSNAVANYRATLDGASYEFRKDKTIDGLTPGTYELCITIDGTDYKQCYEVSIDEAVSLQGKIQMVKNSVQVAVSSGAPPYDVYKNGQLVLQTYQSNFTLQVNHGDNIEVKSKTACEGVLAKTVDLYDTIKAYPNPTSGVFELFVPQGIKQLSLEVYNVQSQLVLSNTYPVINGKVQLNIANKPRGYLCC